MILFLDFDGVLHPARAYMGRDGPALRGDGSLFMWADNLTPVLAAHPHVQLVLSTSWVRHLPFEQVRDFLPVSLRRRVVGSTWHSIQTDPNFSQGLQFSYWQDASRYQQVTRWANVHRLRRWVAIDDDAEGWGDTDRARLIQTDPERGLGDPAAVARLSFSEDD
ncbi:HAD domain-containing protein, partial [Pseudomonas aeruginosa]